MSYAETLPITNSKKAERFINRVTAVTAGGMFIDGYVLGGTGIALPLMTDTLKLSAAESGLIGASVLIGIFIGAPLFGYLTDKFGRRLMFAIDMMIFLFAAVAQAFVETTVAVLLVRLLMGIAIGADYAIGSSLLAEFCHAKTRGRRMALLEVAWYLGYLAAFSIGYFLSSHWGIGWQWILASSAIPALVVVILRHNLPESPRWLVAQGRADEAKADIVKYLGPDFVMPDLHDEKSAADVSTKSLFSSKYSKRTAFACIFWVCQVLPYFAIFTFAPKVLGALGLTDTLSAAISINGLAFVGSIVGMLVIDRIGRRKLLIVPFWITAACMLAIGLWPHAPAAYVVTIFLVFAFFNSASSVLQGVYPMEIFPTKVRSTGVGIAAAASRIGAAAGTFLLPIALTDWGVGTCMLIAAAILALGAVISQMWAPETNGLSLTDASDSSGK